MKSKNETFQCFKRYRAVFEKSKAFTIIGLRSDNGGEYLSSKFSNYLANEGIKHDLGPPHLPQSSGVAERTNQTINNLVRCALLSAKLPKPFWTNALRHVMFSYNSIPMNTPVGFKSPNSILGIDSVKISSLHPFGCLSWYKVPEANRKKLDPKACLSLMLSFLANGGGYRLWDVAKRVVIKSRDVIFNHGSFPYGTPIAQSPLPVMVELPWPGRDADSLDSVNLPVSQSQIPVEFVSRETDNPDVFTGTNLFSKNSTPATRPASTLVHSVPTSLLVPNDRAI
jgi:hypothetical protein